MKSKKKLKLSPRQLQVIPHLLSSPSYEEAAKRSGISTKQIYVWLKNPFFQGEVKKNQNLIFSSALCSLKTATQKAVQTLIDCLANEDARVRLSAAEKILTNVFKGMELYEIEERLQMVEQRIEKARSDETTIPHTPESSRA